MFEDVKDAMNLRNYYKKKKNYTEYKMYRNKCVNLIRTAKHDHYSTIIRLAEGQTTKLWRYINSFKKSKGNILPKSLSLNGENLLDKTIISEELNKTFLKLPNVGISTKMWSSDITDPKLEAFVTDRVPSDVYFTVPPVTEKFVLKELSKLQEKKASGCDGICPKFLKKCAPVLAKPLKNLINQIIDTSSFPDKWKMAKAMAAYKGGAQNDPNNYRPLSKLCTLSKIIERHISIQLTSYLESHQLFSLSQSGFRSGHSCQTCLTKMTNIWLQTLNNKRIIGLVALDLTKAFNVLNHKILLDKLKIYKCSDNALKLLKSYIENRYQFVQLGESNHQHLS